MRQIERAAWFDWRSGTFSIDQFSDKNDKAPESGWPNRYQFTKLATVGLTFWNFWRNSTKHTVPGIPLLCKVVRESNFTLTG
jgi:hypothetical protein